MEKDRLELRSLILSTLSPSQKKAVFACEMGLNVCITGTPGCGKTFTIINIHRILKHVHRKNVYVTASSSVATKIIDSQTFHRFMGISLGDEPLKKLYERVVKSPELCCKLNECEIILIDEAAMLSPQYFRNVDQIFKKLKGNPLPFGGIQVIFCGDFSQLKFGERNSEGFNILAPTSNFELFNDQLWHDLKFQPIELEENHRARFDDKLFTLLKHIRYGCVEEQDIDYLKTSYNRPLEKPMVIFSTVNEVERYNIAQCAKSGNPMRLFQARNWTEQSEQLPVSRIVYLFVGCPVILVGTQYVRKYGIPNGKQGVVHEFLGDNVRVEFEDCFLWTREVEWKISGQKSTFQIPLCVSFAVTIHRCQGMTVEKVKADLSKIFNHSQAYVALSRVPKMDNFSFIGDHRIFQLDRNTIDFNLECLKRSKNFNALDLYS
jgi:energy-coupling factor transporter ATP-binding protein EcfA2